MKLFITAFLSFILCLPLYAHAQELGQVCFKEQCVTAEIMTDDAARTRGLQGRTSLSPDAGMLFVFEEEYPHSFWMKETLIPLDMIWLDASKHVVDVKSGVPPCLKDPCPIYTPSQKALYVLEVNAGYAETHDIWPGDEAVIQ